MQKIRQKLVDTTESAKYQAGTLPAGSYHKHHQAISILECNGITRIITIPCPVVMITWVLIQLSIEDKPDWCAKNRLNAVELLNE